MSSSLEISGPRRPRYATDQYPASCTFKTSNVQSNAFPITWVNNDRALGQLKLYIIFACIYEYIHTCNVAKM